VSPRIEGDVLPARYSIPFFVHPDPETMIEPVVLAEDEVKRYEPVNAGEWRIAHTSRDYGLGDGGKVAVAAA
jgi:isopenicillin N synthase-like dioxygenase